MKNRQISQLNKLVDEMFEFVDDEKKDFILLIRPKELRIGQTIENFKRWSGFDDLFYLKDKEFKTLYKKFIKELK